MPMKIATWNLCLGLFHKKEYVRSLLEENNIDILTLQETELANNIDPSVLQIKGYTFEIENNTQKRRIAIYIKNNIAYKRRTGLEKENLHTIILDVGTTRVITIYRTFKPQDNSSSRDNFRKQLNLINTATTQSTILLGDFNLDDRKRFLVDYGQRLLFEDFEQILGHHHFTQHVTEPTWERVINNQTKNSILDHIYSTDSTKIKRITYKNVSFGDHCLVILETSDAHRNEKLNLSKRNWRRYTEAGLVKMLKTVKWQTNIDSVQEMWNMFEQSLLTVIDSIAPLEEVKNTLIKSKSCPLLRKKQNRRNYLLRKRKRTIQNEDERQELRALNKFIRNYHFEERKLRIRRKIKPGNSGSLWDAVKLANDIEPTYLPTEIYRDRVCYSRKDMPTAFANHFMTKVNTLEASLEISDAV